MTKLDKIAVVFVAIDATLAIMLLTLGKYPILAAAFSALAAANFTQMVCNIRYRTTEKGIQMMSAIVDILLESETETDEEGQDEDEEAENV